MHQSPNHAERALVACSLWLHVGFVGAATLAAGSIQLFEGATSPLLALTLALSGAALAAMSWRRARTTLEYVEQQLQLPRAHPALPPVGTSVTARASPNSTFP